jgi:hypothetical protein
MTLMLCGRRAEQATLMIETAVLPGSKSCHTDRATTAMSDGFFRSPLQTKQKQKRGGRQRFCLQIAAVPVHRNYSEEDKN